MITSAFYGKTGLEPLTGFHRPDTNFSILYLEFPNKKNFKKASSRHMDRDTVSRSTALNDFTVETTRQSLEGT